MEIINKNDVLQGCNFGSQVAEDELSQLNTYFVETEQWRQFYAGECDIVFGAKGSGKSALYSLLTSKKEEFRLGKRTMFLQAENPRGTPAFRDLASIIGSSKITEEHLRSLWKIYFISILANYIRHHMESTGSINQECNDVIEILTKYDLLEKDATLASRLRAAWSYIRQIIPNIEGGFTDISTGIKISGKITLGEPSPTQARQGFISIDALFTKLNIGFLKQTVAAWIVLDRLDIAFTESEELEATAIRSLFRVYLDLNTLSQFRIKIFLRDDIWKKIVTNGFREASHITKTITLSWDSKTILNLIANRLVSNEILCNHLNIDAKRVMRDLALQEDVFYMVFPEQVEKGKRKPTTLDWVLTRLADGTGRTAPREVIQLLNSSREEQLNHWRMGKKASEDDKIIGRSAIQDALPKVSQSRYKQTLCAEYPTLIPWMSALEGEKTEQNLKRLSELWHKTSAETSKIAEKLVDVGFFSRRGDKNDPAFWIPHLYRDALNLVQGAVAKKQVKKIA
jgi:hypothetical protein